MGRAKAGRTGAVAGAMSLWCSLAGAQTFDDRFANFPGRQPSLPSLFTAPSAQTLPVTVPMPPPAPQRVGRAAAGPTGPRARQEELLASAYAPGAGAANPLFSLWLPRLTPVEPAPAEAVGSPAAPERRAALVQDDPPAAPVPTIRARPYSNDLAALIAAKAHKHRVPVALAHAVITVESNYNPNVTGRGATLGLMQIKYATAKGIGYTGTVEQLYDPETNLEWGMRYLGGAYRLAKGDTCGTIMRYQGGHRAIAMNPIATAYCAKVRHLMAGRTDKRRVAGGRYDR